MDDAAADVFDRIITACCRSMNLTCSSRKKPQGAKSLGSGNAIGEHAFSPLKSSYDSFGLGTEAAIDGELFAEFDESRLEFAYLAAA